MVQAALGGSLEEYFSSSVTSEFCCFHHSSDRDILNFITVNYLKADNCSIKKNLSCHGDHVSLWESAPLGPARQIQGICQMVE